MENLLFGEALVFGAARASAVVLTEPLSFWGGYDSVKGLVIDQSHPQYQQSLVGKIILLSHAKGSSSSSSVLAESIRNGTGPQGIILRERDLIICIGSIVARELYGALVPVVVLDEASYQLACKWEGNIEISAADGDEFSRVTLVE